MLEKTGKSTEEKTLKDKNKKIKVYLENFKFIYLPLQK